MNLTQIIKVNYMYINLVLIDDV